MQRPQFTVFALPRDDALGTPAQGVPSEGRGGGGAIASRPRTTGANQFAIAGRRLPEGSTPRSGRSGWVGICVGVSVGVGVIVGVLVGVGVFVGVLVGVGVIVGVFVAVG